MELGASIPAASSRYEGQRTRTLDLRGLLLKEREGMEGEGREWGRKRREGERKGKGKRNKNPKSGYGPDRYAVTLTFDFSNLNVFSVLAVT